MTPRPVRIAFSHISRRIWAGGYNYQRNLFEALNRYYPGVIEPVLFVGTKDDSEEIAALASIPSVKVIQSPAFDRTAIAVFNAVVFGRDGPAVAEFRARRVDMVFESARFFGWRLPFPAVAWFPDFQHRLLPHLFSKRAYWRRDLGFRVQMASARHIMLSSISALSDLRKFYPRAANSVSVVRFATEPSAKLLTTNAFDIVNQYNLPQRFFYMPNQFWRHKNHQIVIDALGLLKARGVEIVVAASGSIYDPREPGYFESTMKQVEAHGLSSSFRHLGMIPLDHVYALLRTSTALINPSKCEGWSTTVEEAKSFGVPMILSNLDVHREQAGESERYFSVDDARALADAMLVVAEEARTVTVRDLRPDIDLRTKKFITDFVRLVRDVMHERT